MTREEYQAKLDDAKRESIGDTYGWYVNLADISLDYIASLESENAKLRASAVLSRGNMRGVIEDGREWQHIKESY